MLKVYSLGEKKSSCSQSIAFLSIELLQIYELKEDRYFKKVHEKFTGIWHTWGEKYKS